MIRPNKESSGNGRLTWDISWHDTSLSLGVWSYEQLIQYHASLLFLKATMSTYLVLPESLLLIQIHVTKIIMLKTSKL